MNLRLNGARHGERQSNRMRLATLCMLLLSMLLSACSGLKQDLYEMALNHERSKAGLEFHRIDVDGKSIAYLENQAKPGQPTLVMIHGFAANKENWVRFSGFLNADYHLLAIDLPGHGQSVKDMNLHYDLDDQVGYLHSILAQLHVDKFSLAGNSMGGAIVSLYAATYPQQVDKLVLIDPAGVYDFESELARQLKQGKNPLIVRTTDDFDRLMDFALEQKPFIPWPIKGVLAQQAVANQAINDKIFADISEANHQHHYIFKDQLQKIQAPTLILWGREDRVINYENADVFAHLIPHAEKHIIDHIGHAPMIEIPQESASMVEDFLKQG